MQYSGSCDLDCAKIMCRLLALFLEHAVAKAGRATGVVTLAAAVTTFGAFFILARSLPPPHVGSGHDKTLAQTKPPLRRAVVVHRAHATVTRASGGLVDGLPPSVARSACVLLARLDRVDFARAP